MVDVVLGLGGGEAGQGSTRSSSVRVEEGARGIDAQLDLMYDGENAGTGDRSVQPPRLVFSRDSVRESPLLRIGSRVCSFLVAPPGGLGTVRRVLPVYRPSIT